MRSGVTAACGAIAIVALAAAPVDAQSATQADARVACEAETPLDAACPSACQCTPGDCSACGGNAVNCGSCTKVDPPPPEEIGSADIPVPPDNATNYGGVPAFVVLDVAEPMNVRITVSGGLSFSEPADYCGSPPPPSPYWGQTAGPLGLFGYFNVGLRNAGLGLGLTLVDEGDPLVATFEGTVFPGDITVERRGGGTGCGTATTVGGDLLIAGMQTILIEDLGPACSTTSHGWCSDTPAECAIDADCADGALCNGDETCVDGICAAGQDLDCADAYDCTVDTCVEPTGCSNEVDPSACTCTPPVVSGFSADFDPPAIGPSVSCPALIGGDLGLTLSGSATVDVMPSTCANDCTAARSGSLQLSATAEACDVELSASATGAYSYEARECAVCDAMSCEASCGPGACVNREASGTAAVDGSRFFGKQWQPAGDNGPIEVGIKCGATLGLGVQGQLAARSTVDDAACDTCEACEERELSGALNGNAGLTCLLEVDAPWGIATSVGCEDCGAVSATGTLGATDRSGDCGDETCAFARVEVEAKAVTPAVTFSALWWTVPVQCEIGVGACAEANSCGTCACDVTGACAASPPPEGGCVVLGGGAP